MRERLLIAVGCFCCLCMVVSIYICVGAYDMHMYHVALPWGIGALLWFKNVVDSFKK